MNDPEQTLRNKVFPLYHLLGGEIPGPLWVAGWEAGIAAQRDVDWQRYKELLGRMKKLRAAAKRALVSLQGQRLIDQDREDIAAMKALSKTIAEVQP